MGRTGGLEAHRRPCRLGEGATHGPGESLQYHGSCCSISPNKKQMTNLVRLFFSTNHKYIRIYFIFGVIVGVMGTCFSVLICIELARPDGQIHDGNRQLYNVLITTLF